MGTTGSDHRCANRQDLRCLLQYILRPDWLSCRDACFRPRRHFDVHSLWKGERCIEPWSLRWIWDWNSLDTMGGFALFHFVLMFCRRHFSYLEEYSFFNGLRLTPGCATQKDCLLFDSQFLFLLFLYKPLRARLYRAQIEKLRQAS